MSARIASAEAFKRANIEFDGSLSSVKMAVERRAGSNAVVKITSDRPFSEPFVDILIELNWNGGRLLREYTFLLDPADIAEQRAPAPAVSTVTSPDVGSRAASSTPAPSSSQKPASPSRQARRAATESKPAATVEQPAAGDYQVKQGDTLSSIAGSLKSSDVSTQQMLAALYKANEDAFINGNINRLRAGKILKVPEAADAQRISKSEAREIVLNASNFDGYRKAVASAAADAPAQQPAASQSSAGKIAPKVAESAPAAAPNQGQLKISQTRDSQSAAEKNAAARVQTLQEELASRNKALNEANSRLAQLEKNVKELQKLVELKNQNLSDLQKQAEAAKQAESAAQKSAEDAKKLAAKQAEDAKLAAAKEAEAAKAAAAREAEEARKAAQAAEQARAAAKAEEDAKVAAAAAAAAASAPAAAEPAPAPVITEEVASAPVVEPQPAPVQTPAPTPAPAPAVVEDEGLLSSPLALGGLLIAALGAGYVVLRNRKRNAKNTGLTMSALSEASTSPNSVFGNAGGQTVDTGTSVLHTDFSQSGLSAIDTDEGVDPVAEADVYMAYGRDAQAEEILLDALKNDPTRAAIYVKLLEIYAQRRSLKQFENIATDLYTQTGGAGDDWAKAAALGARLDPTNPLYRSGGASTAQTSEPGVPVIEAAVAAAAVGAVASKAADSVAAQVEQVAAAEEPAPAVTFGTNNVSQMRATWTVPGEISQFDTSGGDLPMIPEPTPAVSAPPADPLNLDFNLDLELPEGEEPQTRMEPRDIEDAPADLAMDDIVIEPAASSNATDSMNPLEFDIDLGMETEPDVPAVQPVAQNAAPVFEPTPVAPVAAAEPEDFDLGIERAMEKTSLAVVDLEKTNFEGSLLDFDFELGDESRPDDRSLDLSQMNLRTDGNLSQTAGVMETATSAPSVDVALAEPAVSGNEPLAEIDLDDEVTTKLELARAYEEMGDLEGARELLEEVLTDGVDAQKEMAKTILSRIS